MTEDSALPRPLPLTPEHEADLARQAITPETAARYGIYSATSRRDLPEGFEYLPDEALPVIVFPWKQPDGQVIHQIKLPDDFRFPDGTRNKYLWRKGCCAELGEIIRDDSASRVLIVEGTKQGYVAGAYAPDDLAVYSIAGCRTWSRDGVPTPMLEVVDRREVIVLLDADAASNLSVYEAGLKLADACLAEGAVDVTFARLPAGNTAALDDVLGRREESRRQQYVERLVSKTYRKPADTKPKPKPQKREPESGESESRRTHDGRPMIDVDCDRKIVIHEILQALRDFGEGSTLFRRDRSLFQVIDDNSHLVEKGDFKKLIVDACFPAVYRSRNGELEVKFAWPDQHTMDAVKSQTESPGKEGFKELLGIPRAPFIRPDGTVCQESGYDESTKLLLALSEEMDGVEIPEDPTDEEVQAAVDLILNDWLRDFTESMESEADRANMLALLMTPFVRTHFPIVPLALINGLQPGVGKNLLMNGVSIVVTGDVMTPLRYTRDNEEFGKVLTSSYRTGQPMFIFDEAHTIEGHNFSRAITAPWYSDRILGASSMCRYQNNVTWVALGNSIRVEGDMLRRVYQVALRPTHPNPESKPQDQYHHPMFEEWTRQNRVRLMTAILTIIRSYFANGCPKPSRSASMGSFEKWEELMLGILENAGVYGFLGNQDSFRSESSFDQKHWGDHFAWLYEKFGTELFTCREVRKALAEDGPNAEYPPGHTDTSDKEYARKLGQLYFRHRDRFIEGFRLMRIDQHGHSYMWQIVATDRGDGLGFDPGPGSGGSGPDNPGPNDFTDPPPGFFDDVPEPAEEFTVPEPEPVAEESQPEQESGGDVVFDLETCGAEDLHHRDDFVRLSGYEVDGVKVTTTDHSRLVETLDRADRVIGHNIVDFDLLALAKYHGLDYEKVASKAVDTLIVARQLDPPMAKKMPRGYYSLDKVAERLGVAGKTDDIRKLARKHGGFDKIPVDDPDYVSYLEGDLEASRRVYEKLKEYYDTDPYIQREHRVALRTSRMTLEGFRVDVDLVNQLCDEGEERKAANLRRLGEEFGVPLYREDGTPYKSPIATRGGKLALAEALRRMGAVSFPITAKTGDLDTSRDSLLRLEQFYTDPDQMRQFRIDPDTVDGRGISELCQLVRAINGERTVYETVRKHLEGDRVHPTIAPEQASGRWGVKDPGLTVLGKRGGKHHERKIMLPDEGHVLFAVDLDQVDARAIAAHCQDPAYMELFQPGKDLHSEIAMRVFGRCDGEWRDRAKILGHGFNYGLGPNGAAAQAGVELEIAQRFHAQMKEEFPRLEEWKSEIRELAEVRGVLDNGFGRRMRVDTDRVYTQAPALVGQGATRDIMAEGLLRLPDEIVPLVRAIVHDEVVISAPQDCWKDVADEVVKAFTMEFRGVPITAGCSQPGRNWMEVYEK